MGNFKDIQFKLQGFIKKYYTNQLIKGVILFVSFGLLYFLITLLIEYFLWLPIKARTALFFVFLGVELALLIKFIVFPLSGLIGLRSELTSQDASKIIGDHFPAIDDKLLNVLQLNEDKQKSELLLASIEQKSAQLRPIPFKKAIDFKQNAQYLKYLAIPIVIWLFTALSSNKEILNESFDRVVNYKIAYEPPAPFSFSVLNDKMEVLEGERFDLIVSTEGSVVPENVSIYFDNQHYLMKKGQNGTFIFSFSNLDTSLRFYLSANEVSSKEYNINIIRTPRVVNFEMGLNYPSYTAKRNENLKNSGNATIPEGTEVTWKIGTKTTDTVQFVIDEAVSFNRLKENQFSMSRRVKRGFDYQITTSNNELKNYEKLNYEIRVIKDEFPKIEIKSDIDSIRRGPVQFVGQISDDYGLSKLDLVFYSTEDKNNLMKTSLPVKKGIFEEFYHIFSSEDDSRIEEGKAYEMYFEIYDNDGVNGAKSSKSQRFSYYQKTEEELEEEMMKEQKESLDALTKTKLKTKQLTKDFEEFSKKLKNKSEVNWNDKKEFDQFLKRQEQYQEMLEKHTDNIKQNLEDNTQDNEEQNVELKKEQLKKRIEEAQELQKKDRLLEELKKLSEKLDKENLVRKLEKLTERNKQETRTLERILEMTKRFYVEKKANQIGKALDSLAKEQEALSDKEQEENNSKAQEKLNKKFKKVQEDFKELKDQNSGLFEPMKIPDSKLDRDIINEAMQQAKEKLDQQEAGENQQEDEQEDEQGNAKKRDQNRKEAVRRQKLAAQKLKQLAKEMKGAMSAMEGENISEDIALLRGILENLLSFSFDQEQLLLEFNGTSSNHAEYPKRLKKQQLLKEHFEHIDDSIYALAMRQPTLSSKVQTELTEAHYNINRALANIAENRIQQGRSNQQYTMTSANNLADLLSDLLNSLQNARTGSGKGKKGGPSFQLPDLIKKQSEVGEKMKEMMEKGKKGQKGEGEKGEKGEGKKGKGKNSQESDGYGGEQMSGEQYQIYQEQNELRRELQELLDKQGLNEDGKDGNQGKETLKQMEELEKQLLDKGFTNDVMQRMKQMEHELLKLDTALKEQGKDKARKSTSNNLIFENRRIPKIRGEKLFFNIDEILNREPLPLRTDYKRKVQQYFRKEVK